MSFAQINRMGGLMAAPQRPANPFADNADYLALQEYQQSLGPTEEELARLRELQTAFTSSDAYQSHQQEQRQRQQMMAMQRQQMGGIMGMAPHQMQQRVPMMHHPMQVGGYGAPAPQMQMGGNSMQMLMALLAQVFGGGGMRQQMGGGYGSQQAYGQMPQRQLGVMPSVGQATFEGPTANRGGYINQLTAAQPQNMQQQVYAQPQQASPFGGAARGYYA
jgi:hypothetical protein